MKRILFPLVALFVAAPVFAQVDDPNKRDEDLTKDEANVRIQLWQGKVRDLQSRLDAVNGEITSLEQQKTQVAANTKACRDEIYAMLGATEADVASFRERLGRIESRVREIGRMSDDQLGPMMPELQTLENNLNALRREKVALLPEFYNKIIDVKREIDAIRARMKTSTYTVGTWRENRDCLWNIAGKTEIYNDPMMWPKIWQANTDQIRNPDLIYPGQVLQIPTAGPKSDDELRAERLYYRQKSSGRRMTTSAMRRRAIEVNTNDGSSGR